jgi:tyrosinase
MTTTSQDTTQLEWVARVRVDKNAVGGSFSVLVFLGNVPEPDRWYDKAYVGSVSSYTSSYSQGKTDSPDLIEGFVYLNEKIIELSGLKTFDPRAVLPYLNRNLQWRVSTVCTYISHNINFRLTLS